MTYFSEDPTFLAGGFVLFAGACVIALRVTQQAKYFVGMATALALALLVVIVEWMWVTDNERIEKVVYDVRAAVLKSDVDGVFAHLAPNVMCQQGETALMSDTTRSLIRANLKNVHFEFARISELRTSVGQQTRRGIAEFRVFTRGGFKMTSNITEGMTAMTAWSLGFQEAEPGVWKIYPISPVSIPRGVLALPGGLMPSDGSHIGSNDAIGVPNSETSSFPYRRSPSRRRQAPPPALTDELTVDVCISKLNLTPGPDARCSIRSIVVNCATDRRAPDVYSCRQSSYFRSSYWRMISLCSLSS